jgi:hypothetical protein
MGPGFFLAPGRNYPEAHGVFGEYETDSTAFSPSLPYRSTLARRHLGRRRLLQERRALANRQGWKNRLAEPVRTSQGRGTLRCASNADSGTSGQNRWVRLRRHSG